MGCLIDRILPSLDTIEEEAKKIAEEEYERLNNLPAGPDDFIDPAELAERAQDKAIDYYIMMSSMKRGLVGLFTSGLYHLFEQQIFLFFNRGVLKYGEKEAIILPSEWKRLKIRFANEGIELESFISFQKIEILRLTSNVIKHAEGHSAEKLKQFKPEYFMPSNDLLELGFPSPVKLQVRLPLAGEDLNIPLDDFIQYCEHIISFWRELGEKLLEIERRNI